jgi:phosphoglycerol transferase MdoB-like AlkP superfamily enzyme
MLLSEFMSLILFLASVGVYAWKAGRHTWWFIATLVVLGIFIVLNITLYASDYFTGDGINDAVLYTLTNSLTGAVWVSTYFRGSALSSRWCHFWRWPGCCVAVAIIHIIMATACWRYSWRWPPSTPARRSIRSPSW